MVAREYDEFPLEVANVLKTIAAEVIWSVDGGDPTGRNYYITKRDVELFVEEDKTVDLDEQYLTDSERSAVVEHLKNTNTDIILF